MAVSGVCSGGWPYVFSRSCSLLSKYLPISLKQRKEQSHAQCHVKHRIRIFDKISEHVTIPNFQYRLILLSQRVPLQISKHLLSWTSSIYRYMTSDFFKVLLIIKSCEVGAISKAQKAQNNFLDKKLEFFEFVSSGKCCIVSKNVKGGPFVIYHHPFSCKIFKKLEGTLLRH